MIENTLSIDPDKEAELKVPNRQLKWTLIVIFSLAVLSLVYSGWWFTVAVQFEKSVDIWIEQQRDQGILTTYKKRSRTGFPGSVQLTVLAPHLEKLNKIGGSWSSDTLKLSLKPWAFNTLEFDLSGQHQWKLNKQTGVQTLEGNAEKWRGMLVLKGGVTDQVIVNLSGVEINDLSTNDTFQITETEISLHDISSDVPSFKIRIRDMEMPERVQSPLGRNVRHIDAKGEVMGRFQMGCWPGVLASWRDGGGMVDFKSLDIDYPPLRVRGDGTLALDSQMQPVGAFVVKVGGVFATVDALYNKGLIPIGTSFATKIALGVLSKKSEDGGNSYLNMSLTLQDRTLYAGTLKLLKLAPIQW
jgi:hypothetical protein